MAQVEPMDIDAIESDFDNKENAFQYKNVLSRTPCTEKGYEELDVSELNMKLRYSITPASSPMSKSLTGTCLDNKNCISEDYANNALGVENGNLTRSLNSTLCKTEGSRKSKILPLQTLSADSFVDSNRNSSINRLDQTDNLIMAVNNTNDVEENLSLPSTCSSMPDTPEATTPTKETVKPEGSPILRGLKSVLNMFRPSQSPISTNDEKSIKVTMLSPVDLNKSEVQNVQASTPVAATKQKDSNSSKRSSPLKESLVFNDDLERELQWKDETTILFKDEKIPVHKLLFQNPVTEILTISKPLKSTVEQMDISCDESITVDKTVSNIYLNEHSVKSELSVAVESDNEFVDCETTFTKSESDHNKLEIVDEKHTGNVTVDLLNNVEISMEIKSENSVLNNNVCVISRDGTDCTRQVSMLAMDCPVSGNSTHIIDDMNTENEENKTNCGVDISQNIDLQNKSQINVDLQLQDTNITGSVDNQIISDKLINVIDIKPFSKENYVVPQNHEGQSNSQYQASSNMDNLPDVCIETLSNNENSKESQSEPINKMEIKENIEITDDMPLIVKDVNIVEDNFACDNEDTIKPIVNVINNVPNSENSGLSYDSISTQAIALASNTDSLLCNKVLSFVVDNDTPVENKDLNDLINNNEANLNENNNISKNMSLTQATDIVHDVSTTMITTKLSSVKDFVKETNSPSAPLHFSVTNDDHGINVINVDLKSRCLEMDITDTEIPKMIIKESVTGPIHNNTQNSDFLANIISRVHSTSDNDCEGPKLTVVSDTADLNIPSEIPLPDEDETEKNILEYNTHKAVYNTQDNVIEISEKNSILTVGNQIPVKSDQANIILNPCNENVEPSTINIVDEHNVDIMDNEIVVESEVNNLTQTSFIKTCINMSSENLQPGMVICDLQIAQDNVLPEEFICKNISGKMENSSEKTISECSSMNIVKNTLNKTIEVKAPSNDIDEMPSVMNNNIKMQDDKPHNSIPEKGGADIDEEIITSANNSPYVSVTDLDINEENMLSEPTVNISSLDKSSKFPSSPPKSPMIVSKGYDYNFDEVDDPFATKTKICVSPTRDIPNKCFSPATTDIELPREMPKTNNRRTSQSERKREIQKKNLNSKFSQNQSSSNKSTSGKHSISAVNTQENNIMNYNSTSPDKKNTSQSSHDNFFPPVVNEYDKSQKVENSNNSIILPNDGEIKCIEKTHFISNEKSTSSSEQYFSLGTSSGESSLTNQSKNVFNLPEIDDLNFNPFATKSKMRMSPPPTDIPQSSFKATNDVSISPLVVEEKSDLNETKTFKDTCALTISKNNTSDTSPNTSNATCSSKNTIDIDCTVKEILTEDEDTIEGPFLETDDLQDSEKKSDIQDKTDMINFEEISQQERGENLENSELFIDADAFEFLLNQNKNTTVLDSGKESLFLKFDPLFAKRVSSDGILAALNKVQKRQSTPKKVVHKDFTSIEKSKAGPSNDSENCGPFEDNNEDLSSTITKPMMVVNPAVSSIIAQKKSTTPKINRRSLTFTSPAMAVIDRLLSLSGNSSHLENNTSIPLIGREHSETDLAITQLRELLAEKEINVHTLRSESKELKDRLAALEVQVRGLETESAERLAKINELNDRLSEKTKMNKSMAIVVEEYERTIASLIAETEQDKRRNAEERMRLIKERDEQTAHLTSMEVSFSDLHSKYEKSKQIILSCKANEDVYKKSIKEFQDNFSKMQNNYELLKQHATSKLNHANQELEKMNRAHEAEVLKMNALIKRKELHITSLEETLAQKTKANEELTAICDELINKVG